MHSFARITTVFVLALAAMTSLAFRVTPARAGTTQTYIVLYKQQALPAGFADTIAKAGGTLVNIYDAIGVAIARSDSASFRDSLIRDHSVEDVSSTAGFAVKLKDDAATADDANGPPAGDLPNASASD